jgi:hypothetical protein
MIARYFKEFSADPLIKLNSSTGDESAMILRRVLPLTADASSGGLFNDMLGTWVGGTGITNEFWIVNVPPGTYDIYLYSHTASELGVSINGSDYAWKNNTPTGGSAFVENDNYVRFRRAVGAVDRSFTPVRPSGGLISFKVVGTLSGLQIIRI